MRRRKDSFASERQDLGLRTDDSYTNDLIGRLSDGSVNEALASLICIMRDGGPTTLSLSLYEILLNIIMTAESENTRSLALELFSLVVSNYETDAGVLCDPEVLTMFMELAKTHGSDSYFALDGLCYFVTLHSEIRDTVIVNVESLLKMDDQAWDAGILRLIHHCCAVGFDNREIVERVTHIVRHFVQNTALSIDSVRYILRIIHIERLRDLFIQNGATEWMKSIFFSLTLAAPVELEICEYMLEFQRLTNIWSVEHLVELLSVGHARIVKLSSALLQDLLENCDGKALETLRLCGFIPRLCANIKSEASAIKMYSANLMCRFLNVSSREDLCAMLKEITIMDLFDVTELEDTQTTISVLSLTWLMIQRAREHGFSDEITSQILSYENIMDVQDMLESISDNEECQDTASFAAALWQDINEIIGDDYSDS